MSNSLMGIARSHFGQTTIHKLLAGIVDATTPACKKQLPQWLGSWEGI
jgi:hypothetical protein